MPGRDVIAGRGNRGGGRAPGGNSSNSGGVQKVDGGKQATSSGKYKAMNDGEVRKSAREKLRTRYVTCFRTNPGIDRNLDPKNNKQLVDELFFYLKAKGEAPPGWYAERGYVSGGGATAELGAGAPGGASQRVQTPAELHREALQFITARLANAPTPEDVPDILENLVREVNYKTYADLLLSYNTAPGGPILSQKYFMLYKAPELQANLLKYLGNWLENTLQEATSMRLPHLALPLLEKPSFGIGLAALSAAFSKETRYKSTEDLKFRWDFLGFVPELMEYKEKMEYKETTLMEFWRRHGVSDKGRRQLVLDFCTTYKLFSSDASGLSVCASLSDKIAEQFIGLCDWERLCDKIYEHAKASGEDLCASWVGSMASSGEDARMRDGDEMGRDEGEGTGSGVKKDILDGKKGIPDPESGLGGLGDDVPFGDARMQDAGWVQDGEEMGRDEGEGTDSGVKKNILDGKKGTPDPESGLGGLGDGVPFGGAPSSIAVAGGGSGNTDDKTSPPGTSKGDQSIFGQGGIAPAASATKKSGALLKKDPYIPTLPLGKLFRHSLEDALPDSHLKRNTLALLTEDQRLKLHKMDAEEPSDRAKFFEDLSGEDVDVLFELADRRRIGHLEELQHLLSGGSDVCIYTIYRALENVGQ